MKQPQASRRFFHKFLLQSGLAVYVLTAGILHPNSAYASNKWSSKVGVELKSGSDQSIGTLDLFAPLWQRNDRLLFTDLRVVDTEGPSVEGNIGIGYRKIEQNDYSAVGNWAWGVYGFYDRRRSANDNYYSQISGGAELFTDNWTLRSNVYYPDRDSHIVATQAGEDEITLSGTAVVSQQSPSLIAREYAIPGIDIEVGRRFDVGNKQEVWLHGGYFHFDRSQTPEIAGPRVRAEYRLYDVLNVAGSELSLGAEVQDDDIRGTEEFVLARLRIPLGKSAGRQGRKLFSNIDRRMTEYVVRDRDIVDFAQDINQPVGSDEGPELAPGSTGVSATTPITDPATGEQLNVYIVDNAGGGDCTQNTPCTLAVVEADANYGAGDVIIVTNSSGVVVGNVDLTAGLLGTDDRQIVGGDASVNLSLTSGDNITITGLGGRPTLNGTIVLANDAIVSSLDITSPGDGIVANGITNASIDDVAINNVGAEAFNFSNTTGTISISNSSAIDSTGAGLQVNGGNASFALNNFDISDTASGHSLDIAGTTGGSITFDTNSSINNSAGGGVFIDNIGGDITFNGAVSVSAATGNAITATNLNANTVAINNSLAISTVAGNGLTASGGNLQIANTVTNINATGGEALDLSNVNVGNGSGGALTFANLTSTNSSDSGVDLNNVSGNLVVSGNTTVTNASNAGIDITGGSGSKSFGVVTINRQGVGINIDGGSNDIQIGQTNISNPSNVAFSAISMANTTGGSVSFDNAAHTIDQGMGGAAAIALNNNAASFNFDGGSITTGSGSSAAIDITGAQANVTFGNTVGTSISQTGTGQLLNIDGVTGGNNILFSASGSLAATTAGNAGININNSNANVAIANAILSNTLADAVTVSGGSGQINLHNVDIDNAADDGVQVSNLDGTLLFQQGSAVSNVAGHGLNIDGGGGTTLVQVLGTAGANDFSMLGGDAINIVNTTAEVTLSDVDGTAVSGEMILANNTGNVTITNGLTLAQIAGGHFINQTGAIDLNNTTLSNLIVDGGNATYSLTGSTLDNATSGAAVIDVSNVSGGSLNIGAGNVVTAANQTGGVAGIDIDANNSNFMANIDNASVAAANGGAGISISNVGAGGAVSIAGGNITNASSGSALQVSGGAGDVSYGGNITNSGGQSVMVANTTAGNVTLTGSISDSGTGILLDNADGNVDLGSSALNLNGAAIAVQNGAAGTFTFNNVALDSSGLATTAIDLGGATGTVGFGDVDITNLAGITGVSTAGSSAIINMASLDITGTNAVNSTAVDITGSTGSFTVSNAGTIQNVITAFELDSLGTGTTNSTLSYQNGNITAGVPVNTVGIVAGTYDFTGSTITKDFTLSTASGFGSDFWFVDATGGGSGTSNDRASADFVESNSAADDVILLVDDGTGNIAATGGLQLQDNQQLIGFASGPATADFTGANANVLGTFQYMVSDPTGNGAATLTNSGGTETVTLANNNQISDFDLATTGAVDGIAGSGFTGLRLNNMAIANAGAEAFDFTNASGTISITDSSATNSAGAGLRVNGGNATFVLNNVDISDMVSGRSLLIQATTGGSITFDANSSISNGGGLGVLIDNIGGDVSFNGAVSVTGATTTAIQASTLNGNTVAFNGGLGTVSTSAGTALVADGGTLNIAGTTSISAATAQALSFNNLSVGNGSGGALSFDTVASGGGANGIQLSNVNAANGLTVNSATLTGNTTAGININGVSGTLNVTAANIDTAAAGTGLAIAGANGTLNVGTGGTGLDIDGGTTGVAINQTAGTVNLGTGASGVFAVDGTSGTGVTLAGGGTVNIGTAGGSATIGVTTDTGGTAFAVTGGSVDANYAGSINLASNTGLVSVTGGHNGTLTFSGALTNSAATTATQLNFDNADGTYNFDGTVSANTSGGTGIGIDVTATSNATIDFDNALTLAGASGNAIQMDGSGSLDVSGGSLDIDTTSGGGLFQSAGSVMLSDSTSIIASSSGTGINASGGTLSVASGAGTAEVMSTSGQGLLLSNVTLGAGGVSFDTVTSGGGANGIQLSNVDASTGLSITAATLANNTTAGININGVSGSATITAANIDGAATGLAIAGANGTLNVGTGGTGLDIDGGITGVSINQTAGTVNLGTGASGVFAVDGTSGTGVTLAGGGTVNIGMAGGSATIGATTDTGGTAFAVTGGSVDANYAGSINLASNTGLVSVLGGHSGTLTFGGALSNTAATTATQLDFNNADGTYNFDGMVNVNTTGGTGIGIDVTATSNATIDFDNSLTLATASGNAIQMAGSGSLDVSGGSLDIDTTSGTGLSQSAGTVALSDTISIIAAASGTGINASGGTLSVASGAGTAEVISGSGQGLLLSNVTLGAGGVNLDTVTSGGGANGIQLSNVDASTGLTVNSATLTGNTTAGININGVSGTLNVTAANIDTAAAGTGLAITGANGTINVGTGGTGLDIDGGTTGVSINQTAGTVNLGTGASGVFAIDGTSGSGVTLAGGGTVNIGTAGGSASIGATTTTTGNAITVSGGSTIVSYTGNIDNTSGQLLDVQNTTAGSLTITGGTITDTAGGIQVQNSAGNVSISNADLTQANAVSVLLNGNSGDFTMTGGSITNSGAAGVAVQIDNTSGNISFNGTNLTQTSGSLIDIGATTGPSAGTISFTGGTLTGSVGMGIQVQNSAADVSIDGATLVSSITDAVTLSNNTGSFSLSDSFILNTTGSGITGNNTSNLTFDNVTIQDAATSDIAIALTNATGTVNLLNSDINYNAAGVDGLDINNFALGAGTLILNVDNTSFTGDTTSSGLFNAIDVTTSTGSTINATITGSNFTNTWLDGIELDVNGIGGGDTVTIGTAMNGNTFTGVGGDLMDLSAQNNSTVTFDILGNNADGNGLSVSDGIDLFVDDGATVTANIIGNMFTDIGDGATDETIKIFVGNTATANSSLNLVVDSNVVSNNTATGLLIDVFGNSDANVTVTNNTFGNNGNNAGLTVITATAGTETCLAASGNSFGTDQITLTETGDGSILRVPGATSAAALSTANGGVSVNLTGAVGFSEACTIP